MYLATGPAGFGCRNSALTERRTNMSAKALAVCSFEPAAERTLATDHQAPEDHASEIRFREDLWREYRHEAMSAGCNSAQATEYASALSPEMGLLAAGSNRAPAGPGWFYQGPIWVVVRTITSGLIALKRWEKSKTFGRTATSCASKFAFGFRPWNAGGKS
jgi:hypothetical protein